MRTLGTLHSGHVTSVVEFIDTTFSGINIVYSESMAHISSFSTNIVNANAMTNVNARNINIVQANTTTSVQTSDSIGLNIALTEMDADDV
jgi:hypothetical protein